jgi:hypothetical protein
VQENKNVSDVLARAESIAADRDSGASELVARLLPVLDAAVAQGPPTVAAVARRVCEGQRAMAPLWHACAAALAEASRPGAFQRFRQARERAPAALVRVASTVLLEEWSDIALPLVLTLSFSGSVLDVLGTIRRQRPIRVVCGEGRPRFEGRRLAAHLSDAGADVTLTTDASVARYLPDAAAVVVGADSVAATFWINKVGTTSLAAAALFRGVPVFVVAASDKSLPSPIASTWRSRIAAASEVWDAPAPGIRIENHYFEAVPAELATSFLTEFGRLTAADLPNFSERGAAEIDRLLACLAHQ